MKLLYCTQCTVLLQCRSSSSDEAPSTVWYVRHFKLLFVGWVYESVFISDSVRGCHFRLSDADSIKSHGTVESVLQHLKRHLTADDFPQRHLLVQRKVVLEYAAAFLCAMHIYRLIHPINTHYSAIISFRMTLENVAVTMYNVQCTVSTDTHYRLIKVP